MSTMPAAPRNVIRSAVALLLLAACHQPAPRPAAASAPAPAPAPAVAPAAPRAPAIDEDRLDGLLEAGDAAFKAGRLLTPIDNCAYDYYREALKVAPNHPAALHGLGRIADRYLSLAEQAAQRGQFATAKSMLERARIVDPDRDGISETAALIERREQADSRRVGLDAAELRSRSSALAERLRRLGTTAKASDAWVVIRAGNDADGRWIYQQLARGDGETRIRAELTTGSPPAVELLQFKEGP
jgi:tetratricopeptide (TPR) repeat protein